MRSAIGLEYHEPAKMPIRPLAGSARQKRHMYGRSRSSSVGAENASVDK